MITAFPLSWPEGYARTDRRDRKNSRFAQTLAVCREYLKDEIRKLNADNLIISSNQPLKQNGDLRADSGRLKTDDPGVAVYFDWKGRSYTMCCDRYPQIWENLYAIARTIGALRQIDRDGVSDFLERAFTGFPGLPAPGESTTDVWQILGIVATKDAAIIKKAFWNKSMTAHPDRGGSQEEFSALHNAYQQALKMP